MVASRYVKQKDWDATIDILFSGAQALLKAGQYGSGSDLCLFLVNVFRDAEMKPDAGNKGKEADRIPKGCRIERTRSIV